MTFCKYNFGILAFSALFWISSHVSAQESEQDRQPDYDSINSLESRIAEIEATLGQLAEFTMRSGVGAIGYRSRTSAEIQNPKEWVKITLAAPAMVDRIVLVPSIWRVPSGVAQADSFPLSFKIIGGSAHDKAGTVLATSQPADKLLPRIAPVIIDIPPTQLSWIRIEADELSLRIWDGNPCLQLSEVLVFEGASNVALHARIDASSSEESEFGARNKRYLVDGFMPYIMNSPTGRHSRAFVSLVEIAKTPTISIDLKNRYTVTQINLHSTEVSDSIPQTEPSDFGVPRKLSIIGATLADYSDASVLVEFEMSSIYDAGPIIMLPTVPMNCRYLQLIISEPFKYDHGGPNNNRIGFAEIEVLSAGNNVALGTVAEPNFTVDNSARSSQALTDGLNYYGDILPIREWLAQLTLRHELERELPLLREAVKQRYADQQKNFHRLIWLFAALLVATIILVLIQRMIRQRAIIRTREQIAADLHDELGANLHAISLLSELTDKSKHKPERLSKLLTRMRALSQRTGLAARHCTNLLESKELYEDVGDHIRRTSSRLLADLDHEIHIEGEERLKQLSARKRIDLCLFHKEALTNIIRHSGATKVETTLIANAKYVSLDIRDNGQGLPDEHIPQSIKRRSRLLGAKVEILSNSKEGTRILLTYRHKHIPFLK
jgi:signal transduction histidine kinase